MDLTKVVNNSRTKQITLLTLALFTFPINGDKNKSDLIYILQWTYSAYYSWIYSYLGIGQEAFVSNNCYYQNCFTTHNRLYLENILDFNVLLFEARSLFLYFDKIYDFPFNRSEDQLYVLTSLETAVQCPIANYYNGFFNLTWTYKLASDIFHPNILVKNYNGEIIGPNIDMNWMNMSDLPPTNISIVQKLQNKSIAAACVVSNCIPTRRLSFIKKLRSELSKYGHRVHFYGDCGNLSCPRISIERNGLLTNCYNKIESDYYFYLAFENSITEDYVTEKVLHGLQHFAVPVVFGGADYTRFLPDGIYLNALKLGVKKLAKEMNDIINDPPRYYDFFKWHGYYSFHDTAENAHGYAICELCAFLNNQRRSNKRTVYKNITNWWNAPSTNDNNL